MTVLNCRGIRKSYGEHAVLRDVNINIGQKERIGLVGLNGAGKTTLANIIFGSEQPDGGSITYHTKGLKVGYLLQSSSYTIHTFTEMVSQTNSNTKEFAEFSKRLGLKKVNEWSSERLKGLSGGERTKLAIANLWALKPDLIILDEPTNHLDMQGVEWLIHELKSLDATILIISHDRYFLDQTVERIVELEDGVSVDYPGNYSFYREMKQSKLQSQKHAYEEQRKYQDKIHAEISRLKEWSAKSHRDAGKVGKMAEMRTGVKEFYRTKAKKKDQQIKSRIKRLEKIDLKGVKKPKEEAKIYINLNDSVKRGKRIIVADRISKEIDGHVLIHDSSFYIQRGEKVGIIGPNGCGKTTLLNMICSQEAADSGELWIGPSLTISYLTQDVTNLNDERTISELLREVYTNRDQLAKIITLLENMGMNERLLGKSMNQLSLGEKTRFKFAMLIMQDHELLILDEPTNHLDLLYREQLEETLDKYQGTLLIVSHDRYFLERICDKLLVFRDDTISREESGFKEYMDRTVRDQSKQHSPEKDEQLIQQKMIVENRIAYMIGEISRYKPGDSAYQALNMELEKLMKQKKQLLEQTRELPNCSD